MKHLILLTIIFLVFANAGEREEKAQILLNYFADEKNVDFFNAMETFWKRSQEMQNKMGLEDISVECALCGIAVNELEGLILENATDVEMVKFLEDNVCSIIPNGLEAACDQFVESLPEILKAYENRWTVSKVCVDFGFCDVPFTPHVDPVELQTYVINLDVAPKLRWKEVCSNPKFQKNAQYLYDTVIKLLPENGKVIEEIGETLNYFLPNDYAEEIQGCSQYLGVPYGWLTLYNMGYELSDACTSIIAQTLDGKIIHGRNLDFWAGMGFTNTLKEVAFIGDLQKGGKTIFKGTFFSGFVGILSGMRPGAFTVTIDTRFYPGGIGELFYEVVAAITEKNATLVSFLSRRTLENEYDWKAAVKSLSTGTLISDVYYIVSGVSHNEGAIISRNREDAADVWILDYPTRWFEVETNYDHWVDAPWFDNRRDPANQFMKEMGIKNVTLDSMFKVMSSKPVLNIQTTYTLISCAADGTYLSWSRYCPYPCVQ